MTDGKTTTITDTVADSHSVTNSVPPYVQCALGLYVLTSAECLQVDRNGTQFMLMVIESEITHSTGLWHHCGVRAITHSCAILLWHMIKHPCQLPQAQQLPGEWQRDNVHCQLQPGLCLKCDVQVRWYRRGALDGRHLCRWHAHNLVTLL
jgi:hypothetical protein